MTRDTIRYFPLPIHAQEKPSIINFLALSCKMMMMMDGFSAGHDGAHTNEGEGPPVK